MILNVFESSPAKWLNRYCHKNLLHKYRTTDLYYSVIPTWYWEKQLRHFFFIIIPFCLTTLYIFYLKIILKILCILSTHSKKYYTKIQKKIYAEQLRRSLITLDMFYPKQYDVQLFWLCPPCRKCFGRIVQHCRYTAYHIWYFLQKFKK